MTERRKSFTVGGLPYTLSDREVVAAIRGVKPQRVGRYFIEAEGRRYPLKQALSLATGLPPVAFNTQVAYRILTGLGFQVGEERV